MKKLSGILVPVLFFALMALGGWQGARVTRLREATIFYRWIAGTGTLVRVFGPSGIVPEEATDKEYADVQLFQSVSDKAESMLPDLETVGDDDRNDKGELLPKVVRYTNPPLRKVETTGEEEGAVSREVDLAAEKVRLEALWNLASGPALAEEREEFLDYLGEDRLWTVGNQPDIAMVVNTNASLGNLFFGFRKMAANLLWLEADRQFDEAKIHRVMPLIRGTVALDPTFVDAFLIGAWHLSYNFPANLTPTPESQKVYVPKWNARVGDRETFYYEGIDFLKDGIRKNPDDYRLYFDTGYAIYEQKLNDHANGIRYLSEAVKRRHDVWVPRMLFHSLQYDGQYERALNGWKEYLVDWPNNQVAPRFILINEALLFEVAAENADTRIEWAQRGIELARNQGSTDAVQGYEQIIANAQQEREENLVKARDTWNKVVEFGDGKDPFAEARLARMDAARLADQGWYLEAIMLLEKARFASNDFWEEASNLIIDYKLEAGEPLSVTETKAVRLREEFEEYNATMPKRVAARTFTFADGTWYQEDYAGEDASVLEPGTQDLVEFVLANPQVASILEFAPAGEKVVFSLDNIWYTYLLPESNETPAAAAA